jgi:hypothetical protein
MSPGCLIGLLKERMDFVLEGKWVWKKKGCCKTLEEKSSTSTKYPEDMDMHYCVEFEEEIE